MFEVVVIFFANLYTCWKESVTVKYKAAKIETLSIQIE